MLFPHTRTGLPSPPALHIILHRGPSNPPVFYKALPVPVTPPQQSQADVLSFPVFTEESYLLLGDSLLHPPRALFDLTVPEGNAIMTGLEAAGPQNGMPHSPSALSFSQPPSRHTSEIDYDVAQQLIQHAQEGRVKLGTALQDSAQTRNDDATHRQWESVDRNGSTERDSDERQQSRSPSQRSGALHEPSGDSQNFPLVNVPTMGQVCR